MLDLSSALCIDLEATGPDPAQDRITSIAILRYDGLEQDGFPYTSLVNPDRPIPEHVATLTGITNEKVAAFPPFHEIAHRVAELIQDRPLIGFGLSHFDVPLLAEEFERSGVAYKFGPVIDAGGIFKRNESRTLAAASLFYLGEVFQDAHQAEADARTTGRVLAAQLVKYNLADKSIEELAAEGRVSSGIPADPFGKLVVIDGHVCFNTHRNRGVRLVDDLGYARWMQRSNFPLATLRVLEAELERIDREAMKPFEDEPLQDVVADAGTAQETIPF